MSLSLWPWSHSSWIYNYLCNQCLSPLMFWVRISIRTRPTTLCDKVCQCLAAGRWFSPGPPVSSVNKIDRNDITAILLKVALNTIKQKKPNKHISYLFFHVMCCRTTYGFLFSMCSLNNTIMCKYPAHRNKESNIKVVQKWNLRKYVYI